MKYTLSALWLLAALIGCDDGGDSETAHQAGDGGVDATLGSDAATADPDAAADEPDAAPAEMVAFDAPGPFRVGVREELVTYDAPVVGERTLRLVVWYPTTDEAGTDARYNGLVGRPGVLVDATDASEDDAPTLVFSHGNQGVAEQSYFFTEHFASHGWVVAAPDHTGNTFNNNTEVGYRLFELRPNDITHVLDHLAATEADDVVLAGHSFGGYTTLATVGAAAQMDEIIANCAQGGDGFCEYITDAEDRYAAGFLDDRVDVAIPMAPAGASLFQSGLAAIDVPVLLITAQEDRTLPDATEGTPIWNFLDGDADLRLQFTAAGHFSFTDFCAFLGPNGANDGCGEDFTDVAEVHRLTNAFSLAYARSLLFDDAAATAFLGEEPTLFDVYTLER